MFLGNMEEFEKCIKNLKDLNYPGIDMFGPEQLQNIFSQENRLFLLNWLIKNLFGQFDGSLETSSDIKDAEEIGEFLYEIGCCTSEQSNKFVKGDFTLSISEQVLSVCSAFNVENLMYFFLDSNF